MTEPEKRDLGLEGEWLVVEKPDKPSTTKVVMRIQGPDEEGTYIVTWAAPTSTEKALVLRARVEPLPNQTDCWLVEATRVKSEDQTDSAAFLAYAATKDEYLFVGAIDGTKLQKQFAAKQVEGHVGVSIPFVSVSAREGELRKVLRDAPKLYVNESTAYVRAR